MTRFVVAVSVAAFCFATVASPTLIAADDVARKAKSLQSLIHELQSNDAESRKAAAEYVQGDYGFIFNSFYRSYSDDDLQTRISALRREVRPHTAAILKLLKSPHTETRSSAAVLLAASGPGIKGARAGLLEIIHNEKPDGSWGWALFCLPYVCEPREPVGPDLLKSYEQYTAEIRKSNADYDPKANVNAVVTGDSDQPNKPLSEEEIFRSCAANGALILTQILITTDRVDTELPTLLEATREKYSREIRALALITLANLQSEADAALPTLRRLLLDKDTGLRTAAANAIFQIEGDTRSLNDVCRALKLSDAETTKFRKQAEEHFSQQSSGGPRTLEDFAWTLRFTLPALKYGNAVQRRMAYRYLWSQRPDFWRETLRIVLSLPGWICESRNDCFKFDGEEANHRVLHENYRIPGATPLR